MTTKRVTVLLSALALLLPLLARPTVAQDGTNGEHWVATWASAQQQGRIGGPAPRAGGPPAAGQPVGAPPPVSVAPPPAAPPGAAPQAAAPAGGLSNQTVRMIVRTSLGGRRIRVQLSNAFGATALAIGAAHVAIRSKDSQIVAESDRTLLFGSQASVTIPPGAVMISDPVDLAIPKLADLAVSLYLPRETGQPSGHSMALHTTYISRDGDFTHDTALTDVTTSRAWYWVSSVDVLAPAKAGTIVAFGDSITDGATSTPETNRSWPSVLAERLASNPKTAHIAVVNEGISGNRILSDGAGVSALARFDRDVLSVAGVQWLIILEGINDISGAGRGAGVGVSADTLVGALRQMIERAHTHGIKVIGCTLTPAGRASESGEAMRTAVNTFIRTGGAFDAVVDFDAVIRDPDNPKQFRPAYNISDQLHPNDAGYKAMAEAIDLKIFTAKK